MKDPSKVIMRQMMKELDEVIAEMTVYDEAYKVRQKRKKEEDRRHAEHRG